MSTLPAATEVLPGAHWEARYRAVRVSLPDWADDAPHRCVFLANTTGTFEAYAWDRATGAQHQLTARPEGTLSVALEPDGSHVWWFDDDAGDEHGRWRRQPFDAPPGERVEEAVPGLPPAYSAGLALGRHGLAVVGRSTDEGTAIDVVRRGQAPVEVYASREDAYVVDLSRDGGLLVIGHSEHGDSRHMALRSLRLDGTPVADCWHGPGLGVDGIAFSPVHGDTRLLALHERTGRPRPFLWDAATGQESDLDIDVPGEITADWYADARALLVAAEHEARSRLFRYDLATATLEPLDVPRGSVRDMTARPDGSVEYLWTSAAQPPAVRSTTGATVLSPPGPPAPPSVPVEDLWVAGPGGRIHALVSRPRAAPPYPTVFEVHGGPTAHAEDAFSPGVAAWVDEGYAVVEVNYRGSDGYGVAWRDAIEGRPGLTELEDIAAVRDAVVASGLADPGRLVLAGGSWGGYLTLLGLGTQPDRWSLGIAAVPVADYVAAYAEEMEALRAFDRALFGGSPADVPERYVASSPITYVDQVRVPVLVLAGANDPRCPIGQVERYLARLAARGAPHEVYRYDAGHGSLVVAERIRQKAAELDFARRWLATGDSGR